MHYMHRPEMTVRLFSSVQFSSLTDRVVVSVQFLDRLGCRFRSVPCPVGSSGGHEGRFSRDPLPVFSARGSCEQFWHGQACQLFGVVRPALPLPATASPTLQGVLEDDFGEAVVACTVEKTLKPNNLLLLFTVRVTPPPQRKMR